MALAPCCVICRESHRLCHIDSFDLAAYIQRKYINIDFTKSLALWIGVSLRKANIRIGWKSG